MLNHIDHIIKKTMGFESELLIMPHLIPSFIRKPEGFFNDDFYRTEDFQENENLLSESGMLKKQDKLEYSNQEQPSKTELENYPVQEPEKKRTIWEAKQKKQIELVMPASQLSLEQAKEEIKDLPADNKLNNLENTEIGNKSENSLIDKKTKKENTTINKSSGFSGDIKVHPFIQQNSIQRKTIEPPGHKWRKEVVQNDVQKEFPLKRIFSDTEKVKLEPKERRIYILPDSHIYSISEQNTRKKEKTESGLVNKNRKTKNDTVQITIGSIEVNAKTTQPQKAINQPQNVKANGFSEYRNIRNYRT